MPKLDTQTIVLALWPSPPLAVAAAGDYSAGDLYRRAQGSAFPQGRSGRPALFVDAHHL